MRLSATLNLLIVSCVLTISKSFGQATIDRISEIALPTIHNYTGKDYKVYGSSQAILQDSRGVMYFGVENGVLEFDGSTWRLIFNSNHSFPKALGLEKYNIKNSAIRQPGRIYVGGIGEFGYLETDSVGQIQYKSLVDKIPVYAREFEDIWSIHVTEENIIFHSLRNLFLLANDTIKVVSPTSKNPNEQFHLSFLVDGDFYVRQWGTGLLKLVNESLVSIPSGEKFAIERVYGMVSLSPDTMLIVTQTNGILQYDGQNFQTWPNDAHDFLRTNLPYCAKILNDGSLAIGTIQGGVVILNKSGKIVQLFNKDRGLLDNLVFSLFQDNQQNLWVGEANGISHIAFNEPFLSLDHRIGIEGRGNSAVIYNNYLWFGTLRNLFRIPWPVPQSVLSDPHPVQAFPDRVGPTIALTVARGSLLGGLTSGIISINSKDELRWLVRNRIVFGFQKIKDRPNLLLAGSLNGLMLLKYTEKSGWQFQNDIDGFPRSVYYMAQGDNGELWVSDDRKGIFKIKFDSAFTKADFIEWFDTNDGLPAKYNNRVFKINSGIVLSTVSGIYKPNQSENKVLPDKDFERILGKETYVRTIYQDRNENLWMWAKFEDSYKTGNDMEIVLLRKIKSDGTDYLLEKDPLMRLNENYLDFNPAIIEIDENNFLFGTPSGFINYELKAWNSPKSIPILLRKVETINEEETVLFGGALSNQFGIPDATNFAEIKLLSSDKNSLRFTWATQSYYTQRNLYQYQLAGYEPNSSQWVTQPFKEYLNLAPGQYEFSVRAKNIFGTISDKAVFKFEIDKPWYLTYWAFVGYLLGGFVFIWGIVRINLRRLIKQKQKLEEIVVLRTAEIREQKNNIEIEKAKSDNLLLNILPKKTAEELKAFGEAKTISYDSVTVLFSDFKDFSIISKSMTPEQLVQEIDHCFRAFDTIIAKYPLEKIKTIGDAYMCAGGLPNENHTHPLDMINAAFEIQNFMSKRKEENQKAGKPFFEARIGIHTGPVVAGIVGHTKYSYDIWGDTVNTAARIESAGVVGKVNISETTHELANRAFNFEYRGKINVKNLGEIDMYFVYP